MSPGARALSPTALGGVGSPRISSFVPAPAASTRPFSPQNRQSALATSLITTGLHHPRERQASESRQIVTPSPPPYTSKPSSSAGSAGSMPSGIDIARPQKRNMDENNDTAVTYQYFAIEEQEAARQKQKKMELAKDDTKAKSSRTASKPDAPKAKECENPKEPTTEQPQKDANGSVKASTQNPDKKGDGKRKVTFDAHPNIVTIKRDVKEDDEDETLPERADGEPQASDVRQMFIILSKICYSSMMKMQMELMDRRSINHQRNRKRTTQNLPLSFLRFRRSHSAALRLLPGGMLGKTQVKACHNRLRRYDLHRYQPHRTFDRQSERDSSDRRRSLSLQRDCQNQGELP